jgi:hypothetical protein
VIQRIEIRRAISALLRVPAGQLPPPLVLERLAQSWGNGIYAAEPEYLNAVCRLALVTKGPILECGSGLTTLVLAALAGRRGIEIWSLEQDPRWQRRIMAAVRRIGGVHVALAALRSYGEFDWYTLPHGIPDGFRLVICDGPPGVTRGGRYGLLPVMRSALAHHASVLLDDAQRPGEREVVTRWQNAGWKLIASGKYAQLIVH